MSDKLLELIIDVCVIAILYGISVWTGFDFKIVMLGAIYAKIKR